MSFENHTTPFSIENSKEEYNAFEYYIRVYSSRPLSHYKDMFLHVFKWAIASSSLVHIIAWLIALLQLRHPKYWKKVYPLVSLAIVINFILSGLFIFITSLFLALIFDFGGFDMSGFYALVLGLSQTLFLLFFSFSHILATL